MNGRSLFQNQEMIHNTKADGRKHEHIAARIPAALMDAFSVSAKYRSFPEGDFIRPNRNACLGKTAVDDVKIILNRISNCHHCRKIKHLHRIKTIIHAEYLQHDPFRQLNRQPWR